MKGQLDKLTRSNGELFGKCDTDEYAPFGESGIAEVLGRDWFKLGADLFDCRFFRMQQRMSAANSHTIGRGRIQRLISANKGDDVAAIVRGYRNDWVAEFHTLPRPGVDTDDFSGIRCSNHKPVDLLSDLLQT